MQSDRPLRKASILSLLRGARPLVALLCVSGVLLFAWIADEALEGSTGKLDAQILLAFRHPGDPALPIGPLWLLQVAIDLSALGGFTVLWLLSAAAIGLLLTLRRWTEAVVLTVSLGGASVLNAVLKLGFHRVRPDVVPHLAVVSNASFPSGHAMLSAATYLTIGAMLAQAQPKLGPRVYILGLAVVVAMLVGISRLYLGVHWPSDVLAGWCLGAAWALAFWVFARKAKQAAPSSPPPLAGEVARREAP